MAFRLARVPPVGSPICRTSGGVPPTFPGYEAHWVDSGTAALALAMAAAREARPSIRPEVVLPAYGCPDLVAAAVSAGVKPVLVDLETDGPGYCAHALDRAITPHTVAVVAVNFLGIAERLPALREKLRTFEGVSLIEDNAQWFPSPGAPLWGDFVCLSHGRGKPVSVLAGGALLCRKGEGSVSENGRSISPKLPVGGARRRWEIALHNALLHPLAYGILSRIPGLGLGTTRYERFDTVRAFPRDRLSLLPSNVARYLSRATTTEEDLSRALSQIPGVVVLREKFRGRAGRMLRFPILLPDREHRDRSLDALLSVGIGASVLYARPLIEIPGVSDVASLVDAAPRAEAFAGRLLTLPVHPGVTARHVRLMSEALSMVMRKGS